MRLALAAAVLLAMSPALARADDDFTDGARGEKLHTASNFICPVKIGPFERDAVGMSSVQDDAVFCAYSALDGVYGMIVLRPAIAGYDPRSSLAGRFDEQTATGGQALGQANVMIAGARGTLPLLVYTRTFETTKLSDNHYRVLYTGAALGNWAVETTIEYATPRDDAAERAFLNAVYESALGRIARPMVPLSPATPPLAAGPRRR